VENDVETAVKLLDFGIAKLAGADKLTKTDTLLGSAFYMSPECCRGAAVDGRADLYSLGCSLYECLTGRPPFSGSTPFETVQKHLSEPPPKLSLSGPVQLASQAQALNAIVAGCLEKEVDYRYATAAELRSDLEAALRGESPKHLRNQTKPTARKNHIHPARSIWRRLVTIGGAGSLLVAVVVCLVLRYQDAVTEAQVAIAGERRSILWRKINSGHADTMGNRNDKAMVCLEECFVEASQLGDPHYMSRAAREYMSACANHPACHYPAQKKRLHKLPVPFLKKACTALEDLLSKTSNQATCKQSAGELSQCYLELFYCHHVAGEHLEAVAATRKGLEYFNRSDLIGNPDQCHVGVVLAVTALRACMNDSDWHDRHFFTGELIRLGGQLKTPIGRSEQDKLAASIKDAENSQHPELAARLRELLKRLSR
jgi:hypothetical protein